MGGNRPLNYAKIKHYDIANGEGVRISLFVSGCRFFCPNCFNSEAQDYSYGSLLTNDVTSDILTYIKQDTVSGLSLLGGDPLWQNIDGLVQLTTLCKSVHSLDKNVWLWTGFKWEDIFPKKQNEHNATLLAKQELVKNVDILIDGQFEVDKKDLRLKWRGSSNQRVIDVQKSLSEGKVVLYE